MPTAGAVQKISQSASASTNIDSSQGLVRVGRAAGVGGQAGIQATAGVGPYPPTHRGFYDTSFGRTLFKALSSWWRRDTRGVSSPSEIVGHEAYRTIINYGDEMLPYIFEDLASNGGAWYFALRQITHSDPVPKVHYGRESLMRADWLRWAKEQRYLA